MKVRIFTIIMLIFILWSCSGDKAFKHMKRGDDYLSNDNYELAAVEYTKAIELEPNYYYLYMMRCEVYYKQKKFNLAISDCSKAIKLKGDIITPYVNRGRSYAAIGKYDLATEDIKKAMKLNPSLNDTFKRLLMQIEVWKKEAEQDKQQQLKAKEGKPVSVF